MHQCRLVVHSDYSNTKLGKKMKKKELYGRYGARFSAIQALYQFFSANQPPQQILRDYLEHHFHHSDLFKYKKIDLELFESIFLGVVQYNEKIKEILDDPNLTRISHKKPELLLECILKAGIYELVKTPITPKPVILNEYINITKEFFPLKEHQLVNAILDKVQRPSIITD